jgi:hypothetical protein
MRRWPVWYTFSTFHQINPKLLKLFKKPAFLKQLFEKPQVLLKNPAGSTCAENLCQALENAGYGKTQTNFDAFFSHMIRLHNSHNYIKNYFLLINICLQPPLML